MLAQSHSLSPNFKSLPSLRPFSNRRTRFSLSVKASTPAMEGLNFGKLGFRAEELDRFVEVGNKVADAAGEVIRKYFRKSFVILDKEDLRKPLFGTLIALLHKGKPIVGIIDQPVLKERWIGMNGRRTTLNGQEVSARSCSKLSRAYLYTTSPHLFNGDAEEAFIRVRNKVKVPLYGCDCYAYALLASGHVDLVIESGLKPYDFLSLIPVIEGAGGLITDWKGRDLCWEASSESGAPSMSLSVSTWSQQEMLKFINRFWICCSGHNALSQLKGELLEIVRHAVLNGSKIH
ncbi:hypothetical protein QJS04_geneDACA002744 [Acorus gramineus]|uniref:Uncharacterized protein n=1 Tax=Acorus gramineus TaxID=55184 RepID=A0AAV9BVQ1_ACOGR|nr:hypothetical protein QJS04_geneDACA002744 [Acorus gramineus]